MNQAICKPVWIKYDLVFSRLDEFHQLSGLKPSLSLFDRPLVVVCIFSHRFQAKTAVLFLFCLLNRSCEGEIKILFWYAAWCSWPCLRLHSPRARRLGRVRLG